MNQAAGMMCIASEMVKVDNVPATALKIEGTLSTTNIIMANWSRAMWQSVLDRAARLWLQVDLVPTFHRHLSFLVTTEVNCDMSKEDIFI
ncbi:hypothetical protein KIN20_015712 [Parelaphostrongylus tenuis]|uniref:Uncharacterized protein n=1 Tax=Parelaphostrongylus tenuis TaxID=148309 RepID=A0AAD5N0M8_PARTN|nr:hypothetical protein KIN20_015712 [Parelaphostrongylus tenuis]